jgi:hypothetical protein
LPCSPEAGAAYSHGDGTAAVLHLAPIDNPPAETWLPYSKDVNTACRASMQGDTRPIEVEVLLEVDGERPSPAPRSGGELGRHLGAWRVKATSGSCGSGRRLRDDSPAKIGGLLAAMSEGVAPEGCRA